MKHWILLVTLSIGLCVSCGGAETGDDALVGVWTLARADGVRPQDVPPGGFSNFLIEFNAEGGVRSGFPGQLASESFRTYSTEGGELMAWLGLSNDQSTPRRFSLLSKQWLEIVLPASDGFVALFQRVEDGLEMKHRCVPFTVADSVSAEVIESEKQAMMAFESEPVPPTLQGRWLKKFPASDGEPERRLELILGDGSAQLVMRSDSPYASEPTTVEGAAHVSGGHLRTDVLACGALLKFHLEGPAMTLSNRTFEALTFERME